MRRVMPQPGQRFRSFSSIAAKPGQTSFYHLFGRSHRGRTLGYALLWVALAHMLPWWRSHRQLRPWGYHHSVSSEWRSGSFPKAEEKL